MFGIGIGWILAAFGIGTAVVLSKGSSDDRPTLDLSAFAKIKKKVQGPADVVDPGQIGTVQLTGLTPEQKAQVAEQGRLAQLAFEQNKDSYISSVRTWTNIAAPGYGDLMAQAARFLLNLIGGPDKWYTDEQRARVDNAILETVKAGLKPRPYFADMDAGFEGWADALEFELGQLSQMSPQTRNMWSAFVFWLYNHPDVAKANGFPWTIAGLGRTGYQAGLVGRAFAYFIGRKDLAEQYSNKATKLANDAWKSDLRLNDHYGYALANIIENVDKP